MKRIDITTTQNVIIEYKAATFFERLLAWLIDIAVIGAGSLLLSAIIASFLPPQVQFSVSLLIVSPVYLFYHLIFEVLNNGASLGKMALGIRVVKLTNDPVSLYDYFMRWAFRLIDIAVSSGIIAAVTIVSSPRNQRIGDFLADTTVIKVVKSGRFALSRVIELDSLKNYTPVYPDIVSFSEKDMLVIKDVIERYTKYSGESTSNALNLTIDRVESLLGIKAKERDVAFLKTLIKDYVALTR